MYRAAIRYALMSLAVVVVLGLSPRAALADSITFTANPVVTVDGSDYMWTYDPYLSAGSEIYAGDFFTIFDFDDLLGSPTAPSDWVYSSTDTA